MKKVVVSLFVIGMIYSAEKTSISAFDDQSILKKAATIPFIITLVNATDESFYIQHRLRNKTTIEQDGFVISGGVLKKEILPDCIAVSDDVPLDALRLDIDCYQVSKEWIPWLFSKPGKIQSACLSYICSLKIGNLKNKFLFFVTTSGEPDIGSYDNDDDFETIIFSNLPDVVRLTLGDGDRGDVVQPGESKKISDMRYHEAKKIEILLQNGTMYTYTLPYKKSDFHKKIALFLETREKPYINFLESFGVFSGASSEDRIMDRRVNPFIPILKTYAWAKQ